MFLIVSVKQRVDSNVRTAEYDLFKSQFYEQKIKVSKNNNILFIYYIYNN